MQMMADFSVRSAGRQRGKGGTFHVPDVVARSFRQAAIFNLGS